MKLSEKGLLNIFFHIPQNTSVSKLAPLTWWVPLTIQADSPVTGVWHNTLPREEGETTVLCRSWLCRHHQHIYLSLHLIFRCTCSSQSFFFPGFFPLHLSNMSSRMEDVNRTAQHVVRCCWQHIKYTFHLQCLPVPFLSGVLYITLHS